MRLGSLWVFALLCAAPAWAQAPLSYSFAGKGVVLREQALTLLVTPRRVEDPLDARLEGTLRFQNTAWTRTTLVFRVTEDERVPFTYRKGQLCIEDGDLESQATLEQLRREFSGRRELKLEDGGLCVPLGPLAGLAARGAPPVQHRLRDRHQVRVNGELLVPARERWQARPRLYGKGPGAAVEFSQTVEYRIPLRPGGKLELQVTDGDPTRTLQGCCSRQVLGTVRLLRAPASFAMPTPLASRCAITARGALSPAGRTPSTLLLSYAPRTKDRRPPAPVEFECSVDDTYRHDFWPPAATTVTATAASSAYRVPRGSPLSSCRKSPALPGPYASAPALLDAAQLFDGTILPWCAAGERGTGEWVEFALAEDVDGLSLAPGDGVPFYLPGTPPPKMRGVPALPSRAPASVQIEPAGGGEPLATLDVPKGAVLVEAPLALPKGRYRLVVTSVHEGVSGPLCLGELDLVPARERRLAREDRSPAPAGSRLARQERGSGPR